MESPQEFVGTSPQGVATATKDTIKSIFPNIGQGLSIKVTSWKFYNHYVVVGLENEDCIILDYDTFVLFSPVALWVSAHISSSTHLTDHSSYRKAIQTYINTREFYYNTTNRRFVKSDAESTLSKSPPPPPLDTIFSSGAVFVKDLTNPTPEYIAEFAVPEESVTDVVIPVPPPAFSFEIDSNSRDW